MNKITAKEAMQLALKALTESVDLVAAELTGYKEIYSGYPSRSGRIAAMQDGLDAHRNAIAQLVGILAAEATQPPQDERGQGQLGAIKEALESYRCIERIDDFGDASRLVDVLTWGNDIGLGMREMESLAEHIYDSLSEPAQPVALSTLTDERNAFESQFPQLDMSPSLMKGYYANQMVNFMWVAWKIRAASAPAQQAGQPKLTLETAPVGTKATAFNGGQWYRMERGWKWNGPNGTGSTFPRPSGDWDGRLIAPEATPPQPVAAEVPPGMALVPIQPTPEMIAAGERADGDNITEESEYAAIQIYQAMLAASQDSAKEAK